MHQKTCSENIQREDVFDKNSVPEVSQIRNRVAKSSSVMSTPEMPEAIEAL